jgi:tryptophanyl-tRNA synthetase
MPESIQNLFTIMKVVSTPDTVKFFEEQYANCEIRYGDLKKQIAEDVIKMLAPINQKIKEIDSNTEYLSKVAKMGAEKARENASKTLKDVKEIIGFRRFW